MALIPLNTFKTKTAALTTENYNQGRCARDTSLIIDSIVLDIMQNGQSQTAFAGEQYWAQGESAIPGETLQTLAALEHAKQLALLIASKTPFIKINNTYNVNYTLSASTGSALTADKKKITEEFNLIMDIIQNGIAGTTDLIISNKTYETSNKSADLLAANKDFLKAEVVAWINQTYNSYSLAAINAKYNEATRVIIDSLAIDIISNSNTQSMFAGLKYWSAASPALSTNAIKLLDEIKVVVISIVKNEAVPATLANAVTQLFKPADQRKVSDATITAITANFANIQTIPTVKIPNGISITTDLSNLNAYELIIQNKEFIQYEIEARNLFTDTAYNFDTAGYIINCICYDLLHGGNRQSEQAGVYYYGFPTTSTPPADMTENATAYHYLKSLMHDIITSQPIPEIYQLGIEQVFDLSLGTHAEAAQAELNIQLIIDLIEVGKLIYESNPIPVTYNPTEYQVNAAALLIANREFLAALVVAYIDNNTMVPFKYDAVKCSRDVGHIVDCIIFDMTHHGNRQAIQAGVYYFTNSKTVSIVPTEKADTQGAYSYMQSLISNVILQEKATQLYQAEVEQKLTYWTHAVAGANHGLALKSDGTLWAWGRGASGQLGNSTSNDSLYPIQVGVEPNWVSISSRGFHSAAINSKQELYIFGENGNGQVGNNSTTDVNTPIKVDGGPWKSVSCGTNNTFAIKPDGTLWAWGSNTNGQLGIGSRASVSKPTQTLPLDTWAEVSSWGSYTHAVNTKGELWVCGNNTNGNWLGLEADAAGSNLNPLKRKVHQIFFKQDANVTDWKTVTAGELCGMGIKNDGSLWAWGHIGFAGMLGLNTNTDPLVPVQVGMDTNWKSISLAAGIAAATKTNGELWTCGDNKNGLLGTPQASNPISTFAQVGGADWQSVSINTNFSIAVKQSNSLWSWGTNTYGQLGLQDTDFRSTPVNMTALAKWTSMAMSATTTLGINYGKLYRFGQNISAIPVQVGSQSSWKAVACGTGTYAVIDKASNLWTWGVNGKGQLGANFPDTKDEPTKVGTQLWNKISAGSEHMAAIEFTTGKLFVWGSNTNGQLGFTSAITLKSVPTEQMPANTWIDIACGENCTLAIKTEPNSVMFTGIGQVPVPVPVAGNRSFGSLHICGKMPQNGTPAYALTQIGSDKDWGSVARGVNHSAAIKLQRISKPNAFTNPRDIYNWMGAIYLIGIRCVVSRDITTPSYDNALGTVLKYVISSGEAHSGHIRYDNMPINRMVITTGLTIGSMFTVSVHAKVSKVPIDLVATPLIDPITNQPNTIAIDALAPTAIAPTGTTLYAFFYDEFRNILYWTGWGFNPTYEWAEYKIQFKCTASKVKYVSINLQGPNAYQAGTIWYDNLEVFPYDDENTLYTWGENDKGQLGADYPVTKTLPTKVNNATNWKQVSCGRKHTAAIKLDGTLWTWGENDKGQLGAEASVPALIQPTRVGFSTNWVAVTAKYDQTAAINELGQVFTWGQNSYGQLGLGSIVHNIYTPTEILTYTAAQTSANLITLLNDIIENGPIARKDIEKQPISLITTNDENYKTACASIQENKLFITAEVIGYMNSLKTPNTTKIYTAPAGVTSVILSASITNITDVPIKCTVAHYRNFEVAADSSTLNGFQDSSTMTYLIRDTVIPPNDAVSPLSGKLIIESFDSIIAYASKNTGLKIVLSILETANS